MPRIAAASVVLATVLALALASCGPSPGAPAPGSVPFEVLDPAPWETGFAPEELDTWREGAAFRLDVGADGKAIEGGPVDGATVELLAPPPEVPFAPPRVVATTVTEGGGKFRVGPGPAHAWILRISKPGFSPTWVGGGAPAGERGAAQAPDGFLRVAMRGERLVRGVVTDEAGGPVANARLVASSVAYREDLTTDAQGKFVARAPFGAVVLELDAAVFDAKPVSVPIPPYNEPPPVTLVVRPSPPLRGWVQTTDGARIADAVVMCSEDPSIRTRSAPDGRFELRVPRRFHVGALAAGYGWRSNAVPRAGEMAIRLEPVAGLSGVVADAAGEPVVGARLTAVVVNFEGFYERVLGPVTGPGGKFAFSWLPAAPRGVPVPPRILVRRRGLGESAILSIDAKAKDVASPVKLMGARDVAGRAARADGTPIEGALVQAIWGHWDGGVDAAEAAAFGLEETASAATGADGRWRLAKVPLGLHAKVRCAALGVAQERFVDPAAAGEPFDFVFTAAQSIAGRVVAAGGKAPEGSIRVTAQLLNAPGVEVSRTTTAGADGAFRFDDLPDGSYQLRADGGGYDLGGGKVVNAGESAAEVKVERSATLTVKLKFEGGEVPPVPLALTLLPVAGGSQQFKRRIAAGAGGEPIQLAGIYPGAWNLSVAGDVWRGSMDGIVLEDGGSTVIELPVKRTLRVAARLLTADGAPIPRQLVVFVPADLSAGAAQSAVSGDDGAVDLTGLAPGEWLATADPPNAAALRAKFVVVDGANPPLELRLPPSGRIVVRVAKDNGDPIAGAVAVLTAPDGTGIDAWDASGAGGRSNRFRTNAEGIVTITGVRAGKVRVDVRSDPALLKTAEIDVVAGKSVNVDVP